MKVMANIGLMQYKYDKTDRRATQFKGQKRKNETN